MTTKFLNYCSLYNLFYSSHLSVQETLVKSVTNEKKLRGAVK